MDYVICEYEKVRQTFPTFNTIMANLEARLIEHAKEKWGENKIVSFTPESGQIGKSTIMPELFYGYLGLTSGLGSRLTSWQTQFLTAAMGGPGGTIPGSNVIMEAGATGGTVAEDFMLGVAGIAFLDKAIKISEIKMQIGAYKVPRINLTEALVYNKPAVIFEEGFILDEEEGFEMVGHVMASGIQRIKLIGPQLNRVPNKLQGTTCGAAIT